MKALLCLKLFSFEGYRARNSLLHVRQLRLWMHYAPTSRCSESSDQAENLHCRCADRLKVHAEIGPHIFLQMRPLRPAKHQHSYKHDTSVFAQITRNTSEVQLQHLRFYIIFSFLLLDKHKLAHMLRITTTSEYISQARRPSSLSCILRNQLLLLHCGRTHGSFSGIYLSNHVRCCMAEFITKCLQLD